MNEEQLALINSYNLYITHIKTEYNLDVPICIHNINGSYKTDKHVLTVYKKDGKNYTLDIYIDGKIIIHRATNVNLIVTILSETIKKYNIVYDKPLDITKLNIIGIRCEGKLIYDTHINLILPDNLEKKRDYWRLYYNNANASIIKAGVVINSDSYDILIHICKQISASAPVVLCILQHNNNSLFNILPADVIGYILQYMILLI